MARKTSKLSTRDAIAQVLGSSRKPMRVKDIIVKAVPLTALKGATPGQTVYSVIYAEGRKANGMFEQVDKGTFKLRTKRSTAKQAATSSARNAGESAAVLPGSTVVKDGAVKADPKPRKRSNRGPKALAAMLP